jgi:hypothetical protein
MTNPHYTPQHTDAYYSRLIITDLEEMRDLEIKALEDHKAEGGKVQSRIDYLGKAIHVVSLRAERAALESKGELSSSPLAPLSVGDSCIVTDGAPHTSAEYFSRTGEVVELKPHGPGTVSVKLNPLEGEDAEDMKERAFIFFESAVQPLHPGSNLAKDGGDGEDK